MRRREAYRNHEPFQEFLVPAKIKILCGSYDQLSFDKTCLWDEQSEQYVAKAFGFTPEQAHSIERDYSKSRRQAPIYWPLSTASGFYTLWLYYHRLTDQMLYACVNDFVEPKLKEVGEVAGRLRQKSRRRRKK